MIAFVRSDGRSKQVSKTIGSAVLLLVLAVEGYLGAPQLTGNFHTVIAGALYRSARVGVRLLGVVGVGPAILVGRAYRGRP